VGDSGGNDPRAQRGEKIDSRRGDNVTEGAPTPRLEDALIENEVQARSRDISNQGRHSPSEEASDTSQYFWQRLEHVVGNYQAN